MSTVIAATASDERPVFFEAGTNQLFGILTAPVASTRGIAIVVLPGGGTPLSTNVNDFSPRLCRRSAGIGFHAFRFDYHGVGESDGEADRFHLGSPFAADLEGALVWLRALGLERFVLIGSCFGARTALAVASRTTGVQEAILISPPVRDFEMGARTTTRLATELTLASYARRAIRPSTLRGLASADRRHLYARLGREKLRRHLQAPWRRGRDAGGRYEVSPLFLDQLEMLVDAKVSVVVVYGDGDDLFSEFERGREGRLGRILARAGDGILTTTLPGVIHGFPRLDAQDEVFDLVMARLLQLAA